MKDETGYRVTVFGDADRVVLVLDSAPTEIEIRLSRRAARDLADALRWYAAHSERRVGPPPDRDGPVKAPESHADGLGAVPGSGTPGTGSTDVDGGGS